MRRDNRAIISASRTGVAGDELPEKRARIYLYRQGEKQPGKDPWQYLCETCPLPDCIRHEGDMTPLGAPGRTYPGCPIYDEALRQKQEQERAA
jgi:hypothetical protein